MKNIIFALVIVLTAFVSCNPPQSTTGTTSDSTSTNNANDTSKTTRDTSNVSRDTSMNK